ncbi:MAG TPA: formyltransferase family protein, partial [Thermoanaerobaculia bacterium]
MTERLRLVVFTSPAFSAVDRVFFERLAADPLLELVAIVVDEYRGKRKALPLRVTRSIAKHGPAWIVMKIEGRVRAIGRSLVDRANDAIHGRRPDVDWQPPAPLHRVADIHSEESLALVRSLSADLGVIAGGRILRDELLSIPRHGTLNIHKRRLPEYRGGGPVGYWEILAGETSLGISIHYATAKVDAGPILAEATIPIDECDTLASLSIKADLRGAQLYHQTLQRFAKGHRIGVAQDLTRGKTYRAPSDYEVARLERRLEQRAARAMDLHATPWRARVRVLLQFALLLPYLRAVKARFTKNRRAPVMIFFYHLVADRPLNDMCVRLPVFVTQVEFLRRHFALLTLDETVRRLAAGSNDELAACITFDDGYRENRWAIEYLRYFEVPAAFFVSTGHVRDGKAFEHDLRRGYSHALPMSEEEVAALTSAGFVVGSHGVHHEDFGALPAGRAIEVLQESRDAIEKMCGSAPTHFAFPKGKRGINITPETYDAALRIYPAIYSAYGGCSYPRAGRRHFVRRGHASDLFELSLAMSGYTGFRDCINGNAWSKRTDELDPRTNDDARVAQAPQLSIALVAASPAIVGGQSVQATALIDDFRAAGHRVSFIPIDVRFPAGLRWMRRVPYL